MTPKPTDRAESPSAAGGDRVSMLAGDRDRAVGVGAVNEDPPVLTVTGLTRRHGARSVLEELSFTVGPGVTGLLGLNGAGKSRLLACLAGVEPWDAGRIEVGGIDLGRRPAKARRLLGYLPERVALPEELRVTEYLEHVAWVKRVPRRERRETVELAMTRTGLTGVRTEIMRNVSTGHRQRIGIGQALIADPPLVLLDEPMNGLDPLNAADIRTMLTRYARTRAVLVSTHLLADVPSMCDRVLIMAAGRLTGVVPGGEDLETVFRAAVRA